MKRKKKRENSSKSGVINIFERIYIKKNKCKVSEIFRVSAA